MNAVRWYVTTAIPFVNADPHLGHALEFVETDTLARWRRLRGDAVRSLWGTDDNALKNATAAHAAGIATDVFVDRHAARFAALGEPLQLGFDDFIRTSRDPRHRAGVQRLWRACRAAGDLYLDHYRARYCAGCEQFYDSAVDACAEHPGPLEDVAEQNWFFRLSRYVSPVRDAVASGALRVAPAHRRNEVLAFLAGAVRDVSVSRPAERSGGWGIPVPDDPTQVVYVWFDALTNYISALGYGTGGGAYEHWWRGSDRRVHVVGKGITRFHAVFWPAFLLSAGEPLPTDVLAHEYLTADGAKISKSSGTTVEVAALLDRYGGDADRRWLLTDVSPRDDTDFRASRLVERHDQDLANGLGNLVNRVAGLARRAGAPPAGTSEAAHGEPPTWLPVADVLDRVDRAVESLDFRAATSALGELVTACNRRITETRPWELTGDADGRATLAAIVDELRRACVLVGRCIEPFLPDAAAAVVEASVAPGVASSAPLFPRLAASGDRPGTRSAPPPS